jgi:DNA polymerase I-like protein with 3'-5' exonuclease and polymerase domains
MKLVCDLETDGLLQEVTKIHCASVVAVDSSYSELYIGPERIKQFLELISNPEHELIWQNGFNYDLKVLEKLFNWKPFKGQKIHDTQLLAQLLFSDLWIDDDKGIFPGRVFSKRDYGSHSLRAWGQRLKCYKGDYTAGWEEYNDDMGRYCIQDTYTTKTLFLFLESKIPEKLVTTDAIDLEYAIAPILARQQAYGVLYDQQKSNELVSILTSKLVELRWKLQDIFKPRYISLAEFTPKRDNKASGYKAGATFTKIELEEFNPSSRSQIVDRLKKEFGWDPTEFTDKGNAKMDEEIIDALPFKELQPLKEYLQTKSVIAKVETGKQAWIKHVDTDGRIRGAIRQNGAVTGRMTHYSPNLAQVPSERKLYGKECRELFIAGPGKVIIGVDADALEMRILAGYLSKEDGGKFRDSVLHGKKEDGTDPHSLNAEATNIDRDTAKTEFYADIYGARNAKKGKILLEAGIDFREYVPDFDKEFAGFKRWAETKDIKFTDKYIECAVAGKQYSKLFGDRLPELPLLKKKIHSLILEKGYVKGLDGRKLFCRSEHGELNTVCQSAGAIVMKKALHIADNDFQEKGLIPGKDYEFILNVHDELELECIDNEEITAIISNIVKDSIRKAGEYFNFPCPLSGNVKIGKNWGEVH